MSRNCRCTPCMVVCIRPEMVCANSRGGPLGFSSPGASLSSLEESSPDVLLASDKPALPETCLRVKYAPDPQDNHATPMAANQAIFRC